MDTQTNPGPSAAGYIEVAGIDLRFRPVAVSDPTPTGAQILSYCDVSPREQYIVLQWLPQGDIEELRADEITDLTAPEPAKFLVVQADRLFRLVLNDRSISWPEKRISAVALRQLGKIDETIELYLRREDEPDKPIEHDAHLSLADVGVEVVYSRHSVWKLNVQGVPIESKDPELRVRAALAEAGFDPDQGWIIVLKTASGKRQVSLDDVIDLREPGIEKLRLTPREINNG